MLRAAPPAPYIQPAAIGIALVTLMAQLPAGPSLSYGIAILGRSLRACVTLPQCEQAESVVKINTWSNLVFLVPPLSLFMHTVCWQVSRSPSHPHSHLLARFSQNDCGNECGNRGQKIECWYHCCCSRSLFAGADTSISMATALACSRKAQQVRFKMSWATGRCRKPPQRLSQGESSTEA